MSTALLLAGVAAMPVRVAARRARRGPAVPGWSFTEELTQAVLHTCVREVIERPPEWGRRVQTRVPSRPGRGVERRPWELEGEGMCLERTGASERGPVIFYLHGGGYVVGDPATYAGMLGRLLSEGGSAYAPRYRLAPEHPMPAALDDALQSYLQLASQVDPARLIIAGDSAGGGLALSLARRLALGAGPAPRGVYLLSPWVDPFAPLQDAEPPVDMLTAAFAELCSQRARGECGPKDPEFVPHAGCVPQLPPLRVDYGEVEIFAPQIERYVAHARALGVHVDAKAWPRMFHVFVVALGFIPSAATALDEARAWIWARLEAEGAA